MDTNSTSIRTESGDDYQKLLRQQKQELSILNAIIQIVSNSYNLRETLEAALDIILTEIDSTTGWICLLEENAGCSAFVGHKGLCFATNQGEPTPCLVRCVCNRVRRTGDAVIVKSLKEGCPLLEVNQGMDRPIIGHVSVPLMTKSRIVGQLNVAFDNPRQADAMDIDLLRSIGPQLAVAIENARLWDQVQEKEALQKELLKKVVTAQEEERRRISRELHDELGQELTSLLVRFQVLEKVQACQQSGEIIGGIKTTVSQLLASIHDMALELRPTTLDDLGLMPALSQYLKTCPERLGIEVDFEMMGINGGRLPREVETTLYRVIQESLTNVARHSQVNKASVLVKQDERGITAIIEDIGVGFDPKDESSVEARKNRLGLYGMEERVSLVGGTLTIESQPGAGTTIFIEIPVTRS